MAEGTGTPTTPPTDPDQPIPPNPTNPNPPTNPEAKLTVNATPGGTAPWGVRYDVTATGFPEGSTLETVCRVRVDPVDRKTKITDNQIDKDSFACYYSSGTSRGRYETNSGYVRVLPKGGGKPLAEETLKPNIADEIDPLYFSGTWRYTYTQNGVGSEVGTFATIKPGPGPGGQSEDGAFNINLESRADEAVPYYEDNREVQGIGDYLIPDPLQDGTQRYVTTGGDITLEKVE